jgi:ankyrin repeat protein
MMSQRKSMVVLLTLLHGLTGCRESLKTEGAALLASARTGHSGTARDMLASGANVNVKNERGNTALIEAARNGHDDVVCTLLTAGADVKVKNNEGKTALMMAAQGGHEDTARVLRQSGAVSESDFRRFVQAILRPRQLSRRAPAGEVIGVDLGVDHIFDFHAFRTGELCVGIHIFVLRVHDRGPGFAHSAEDLSS